MDFTHPATLGRTGLRVGRLGIASGYWAPADALELAFERGCNYFTWGTFVRGRSPHLREAVRRIVANGQRDRLVLSMFSYAHVPFLTETFFARGLKALGVERSDVLVLGYFGKTPSRRILDGALRMKEKGLVRFIGLSGHNRRLFAELRREGTIDLFHIRYSAVHPGAESDAFPHLGGENRPGIVTFTAAAWGKMAKASNMPPGERPPAPADCYRFALSHPAVDVCMVGARSVAEMREDLEALKQGPMAADEIARMRRIGDHVYGKPRAASS
jgi:aryl-alcohol dehydrogenase-like predicted oxidoreductase